ncbi:MAG: protein kinase [Planctomycetota bacterium]
MLEQPEPVASEPAAPLRELGPFAVEAELGRGGMAQVYRVRYRGQRLALKLLHDESPDVRERLAREAELVGALEHPGIVRLLGLGSVEGRTFLLYELLEDAETLDEAWRDLGLEARVELLLQIADAVGFAHSRGIVHRDLKPENVLVDPQGRPRVIDFGLAWRGGRERLTHSGLQLGTQAYMAPEQFSTDPELQRPAVDVWSLGVLLYEALTGRSPFPAHKVSDLRAQHARPPSPCELEPRASQALAEVCLKALSVEQEARQATAAGFASELRAALLRGPDPAGARAPRRLARGLVIALVALGAPLALIALSAGPGGEPTPSEAPLARPFARLEAGLSPEALQREARARLARDPHDPDARAAEAAAYTRLGDQDAAQTLAEGVLAEDPAHLGALHALLESHVARERVAEAREVCARLQAVDPDDPLALLHLSRFATRERAFTQAEALADRGLAHADGSAALWAARGSARLGQGLLASALEDFSASLARSEDPAARLQRAAIYLQVERPAEALEDLQAVYGPLRQSRAWTTSRIRCLLVLDRARARAEAEAFQRAFPDAADANFFLGEALRRVRADGARRYLERARELEPDSPWAEAAERSLAELK